MPYPFHERLKPQGYVDKLDDSLIDFFCLVRGSFNTLISDTFTIVTRKGMALVGAVGSSVQGIKSAYTWETNSNKEIPMRFPYDKVQALYLGTWKDIGTGFGTLNRFRCRSWWNKTEVKDQLLMVNGDTTVKSWSGGMSEILSWTATTVTKKYAKQSQVANTFTFNSAGKTLTQVDADFITAGFVADQVVRVTGTTSNNRTFTIKTVSASVLTFSAQDTLVNEVIATNACVIGVVGKETWFAERFVNTGGVYKINIGGTVFDYTGGATTPTLTGLSADPSGVATVGGFAFQPLIVNTPTGGDFPSGSIIDIIEVYLNNVLYGYTLSKAVYISKSSDFKDCGYTAVVRKAGEGGTIYPDSNTVSIAGGKEMVQITAGSSDVYNVTFEPYSDGVTAGTGEIIKVKKLATAYGQGASSADVFVKVKNGIAYLSQEPTIDFIGNIEQVATQQAKPLSDSIKRLLLSLDRTDATGVYAQNYLFYFLPKASVLLMFDMERGFWQPPQIMSGSCLSLIGGLPHLHSATTDETYKLFSGMTDNGNPISFSAYGNVDTYGTRSKRKEYDEFFIEALVNGASQNVLATLSSGYRGATKIHPMYFGFNDNTNFTEVPALGSGLGSSGLGVVPFGGLFTDPTIDPDIGALKKIYKISPTSLQGEAFTHQMQITGDELGSYWEIVCFGTNARGSDTNNSDLIDG